MPSPSPTQLRCQAPTALLSPLSAGYTAGGVVKVNGTEAACIALFFMLLIAPSLPLAHAQFGILPHLSMITVAFLSIVAAIYYGVLVGVMSWIGGGAFRGRDR